MRTNATLRAAVAANPEISTVITADREATHGSVVHVIDLARGAGVVHFAVNVERAP